MANAEDLGPATSWHIRSVPEAVRQAVVDRAHSERVSVGELLTRLVVGGDSGPVDTSHAVDVVDHAVDADRLLKLLQAAEMIERLPKSAQGTVRSMITAELRSMRRQQKGPSKPLALPAPEAG